MTDAALRHEQIAYYDAIANEYEDHVIDAPGGAELRSAFDRFDIGGDVLELASGPGMWTEKLLRSSTSVTAVDSSPQMIKRARERVGSAAVRFIESDLFRWQPDRRYDTVFFGFWLSHVPEDQFENFWSMVADCLRPEATVCFVDDSYRTDQELIEGPGSALVERTLNDGTRYRAIKVPHRPDVLEQRLRALGWNIEVRGHGPFYWGSGQLA